jgi:hypothetical protein
MYMLLLTVGFAVLSWVTGSAGQEITKTYAPWAQTLWYGGLTIGAALALAGIIWHTEQGLLLERAALVFLTGLCGSYSTAFLLTAGRADPLHALFVVVFVAAFGAVNLARARQIRLDLRDSRAARLLTLTALQPPEAGP